MKATIFDIQRGSFVDGPGTRTTVFFKGCNLKCKWCHNPESQKFNKEMFFFDKFCTGCGTCKTICPNALRSCDFCGKCELFCPNNAKKICGKEITVEQLMLEILKDKPFYKDNGGVTFSGGECLLQENFLTEILKKCKENGIHTAVDTAGNVSWGNFCSILPYTDLFLYDIKCITKDLHVRGTGFSNDLILENLKKLTKTNKEIIIRVPVITEFNGNQTEMLKIANFVKALGKIKVELLPYHAMGEHKWHALNMTPTKFTPPSNNDMKTFNDFFINNN